MGRTCFIPNCRSGYTKNNDEKVSLFKPPANLLSEWKRKIPRKDRELTEKDFVCEKHFNLSCILRSYDDGVVKYPLKKPRLVEGSLPTIFPNCPAYLTTREAPKRRLLNRVETTTIKKVKKATMVANLIDDDQLGESSCKGLFPELCTTLGITYPNETWNSHRLITNDRRYLSISKMFISENGTAKTEKQILLHEDGTLLFSVYNEIVVNEQLTLLSCNNIGELEQIIKKFDQLNICTGGPSLSLYDPINIKPKCASPDYSSRTWRHKLCPVILLQTSVSNYCSHCNNLKKTLGVYKKRLEKNKVKLGEVSAISHLRKIRNAQRKKLFRLRNVNLKIRAQLVHMKQQMKSINTETLEKKLQQLSLPDPQKLLIKECIQICKNSKKNSRRYTGDWLISCLLLHIRSPTAYNFLKYNEILPLPATTTIRRYLQKVDMKCGLDEHFFEAFRKKMCAKNVNQKHGILVFDEMQVRKSINVNVHTMKYTGVVDFGSNEPETQSTDELADHALVFMFSSLAENYSQPVAVYAAKGPTKGTVLAKLLTQIVIKLEEAGAFVDAIICDGATTNRRMWKDFGISGSFENSSNKCVHPSDENRCLYFFSDTPHLFKCIRNRLLSKHYLRVPEGIFPWKHYEIVYREDMKLPGNLKVCPKISYNHIYPSHMLKMRVKLATQVFSNSMTHGLLFYKNKGINDLQDADGTIRATRRLNNMFDVLNRKIPVEGIRKGSVDLQVMQESLEWLNVWEKRRIDGIITSDEFLSSSTAEGLRVTLTSSIDLVQYLLEKCNFHYVLTAKVNQDSLERFFGSIRQAGCSNDHPSFVTFIQLYRMLSTYKLIRPPKYGNCSVKDTPIVNNSSLTLDDFKTIFNKSKQSGKDFRIDLKQKLDGLIKTGEECEDVIEYEDTPEVVDCVLYYVVGYVCLKFKRKTTCDLCKSGLVLEEHPPYNNNPSADLTNQKTRGFLTHPNQEIYNILRKTEDIFRKYVYSTSVYEDTLTEVLSDVPLTFPCETHKYDIISHILHYFILMRMRQYFKAEEQKGKSNTKEKRKLSKLQNT